MIPSRLDKFLSDATNMSRRDVRAAFDAGRIVMRASGDAEASKPASLAELVFADDEITLDEQLVEHREPSVYVLLNKPPGVMSSASDPNGRPCLDTWLGQLSEGVFPVGRLDKETSGAVLLTDDGDLAHVLTTPEFGVQREYRLMVDRHLSAGDERVASWTEGVRLQNGEDVSVRSLQIASGGPNWLGVRVEVEEARSRLIRQICHVLGLGLCGLHRTRIGPVSLGPLSHGALRELEPEEVEALWAAGGGRAQVDARRIDALERLAARFAEQGKPHARLEAWLSARMS